MSIENIGEQVASRLDILFSCGRTSDGTWDENQFRSHRKSIESFGCWEVEFVLVEDKPVIANGIVFRMLAVQSAEAFKNNSGHVGDRSGESDGEQPRRIVISNLETWCREGSEKIVDCIGIICRATIIRNRK
jgi:hypothetical protein